MKKNYFISGLPMTMTKTVYLLLVMSFLISISSYSQDVKKHKFTTSGSFEVPAGVGIGDNSITVQTWGAGGGGGGPAKLLGIINLLNVGGGGGGGAFNEGILNNIDPDQDNVKISYIVGAGGAGGVSGSVDGEDGGESFFSTISANGGKGGEAGIISLGGTLGLTPTASNGIGGKGGTGGIFSGGDGFNAGLLGESLGLVSGSGGGGAGSGGAGIGSSPGILSQTGGAGGAANADGEGAGGKGGDGLLVLNLVSGNGAAGGFPGGGGGGSAVLLGLGFASPKGGVGGNGQIKIEYTCPIYTVENISANNVCVTSGTTTLTLNSTVVGLPVGKYTVTYDRSSPLATGLTSTMIVPTAGIGTINVSGLPTVGLTTIKIKKLTSVDCSTDDINMSITLGKPEVPIAGTMTPPTCAIPTGSVVLSGLSDLSTWSINATPNTIGLTGLTGTGTTTTISGLTPGTTYNFTVSNGSCISSALNVSIANLPPTRTWNGSWDAVPTIENKVIFATSYDENESVEACSCEVKSGAAVTFKIGRYLKIRNELVVNPAGSLTFENNASLVQINDDAVNSGNIIYKRHTKPVKRYDYTYWSSPVEGQTLYDLSPNTLGDKYHSFDSAINNWATHYNGNHTMLKGEGYIIRAPQTFSITLPAIDCNPKFIGKPNNGEVTKELDAGKLYLLGNPYPSAMNANQFLDDNSAVLEGTLYFWTHNSPPSDAVGTFPGNDPAKYNYTTNDYASYNKTGGVITAKPAVVDGDLNDDNKNFNGETPTGKIAAGQGFFAPAKDGGTIVFNNSMRLFTNESNEKEVMDNSQFFKFPNSKTTTTAAIEKSRLWLNLTNAEGAFKQTLIGYISGATNEYEGNFDGMSFDGNEFVDFYSVNQGANLSIQGRALPFQQKDSVALGYRTKIKGEFQISIDHADGALASQKVFLEDKIAQVLHDLKKSYSFTTEEGVFNDRFVLRYEDKNAVIIDAMDVAVEGVLVSTTDKNIKITTVADAVIKEVYIYNFSGGLVYSDTALNTTATTISNLLVDYGGLIVQVVLKNGKKAVKKIIY